MVWRPDGMEILEILEWCGYPMVEKFDDMFSRFDTIPACDKQTDRQTDGQTDIFGMVSCLLSIVTMPLSCIISEIKQVIGRKLRYFLTPCISREYCHAVWYRKTRMVWLTETEKI